MLYRWEGKGAKQSDFSKVMADDNDGNRWQKSGPFLNKKAAVLWSLSPTDADFWYLSIPPMLSTCEPNCFSSLSTGVVPQLITTSAGWKKYIRFGKNTFTEITSVWSVKLHKFFQQLRLRPWICALAWERLFLPGGRRPGWGLCWWPSSVRRLGASSLG